MAPVMHLLQERGVQLQPHFPAKAIPDDFVCLKCHDGDELIEATSRPDADRWQNPHNNLHYGSDVSCMECHGEHEERQPLCSGCHAFDYPGFKHQVASGPGSSAGLLL